MSDKKQTFLITVTILEGRHYAWLDMDSAVIVKVGDIKKCTKVKHHSDCPYYNEYFVFEFNTSYDKLIDQYIIITVIQPGNIWRKRKILGEVLLDIATVWNQKGHQFYHKWAILSTPKGHTNGGPRGYIKLDISILAKGETPRLPTHITNDDIEGNLLLPEGIHNERQRASYIFDIYRWENSEKCNPADEKNKNVLTTYVEITFAGIKARTSKKKHTNCPVFNERLEITELFPPLCQRIKVEVCSGDSMRKTIYANRYINLKSISNEEEDGFLPTFGPIFLHMYSTNNLQGYVGTILMSMYTELEEIKTTAVNAIAPLDEATLFPSEEVTLFCCIFEVTSIDKTYSGKPISVEMTFGKYAAQNESMEDIVFNRSDQFNTKKISKTLYCLNFDEEMPILWILQDVPFFKKRIYNSNILSMIVRELRLKLSAIEEIFATEGAKTNSNKAEDKILDVLDYTHTSVRKYIDIVSSYKINYNTKLDNERMKLCLKRMNNVDILLEAMKNKVPKKIFRKLQDVCQTIDALIEDVQECWPDIFLWILQGSKKIAFYRIPARDIIYSPVVEEKGQYCSIQRSACFYAQKKKLESLVCKMSFMSTLCFNRHKAEAITNVLDGFKFDGSEDTLSRKLIAQEKTIFDLKVYIFQGKISAGFDKSGLADPFVRFTIADRMKETQVIKQCLNPIWDETLIFGHFSINGSREFIRNNIPTVLMEVYDKDPNNTFELIGRTMIKPNLNFKEDPYSSPKLNWQYTYEQYNVTSEILLASEYVEVSEDGITLEANKPNEIIRIPKDIKPDLVPCKMDVLFWGVRDLKTVNLLSINRPRISVFCGDDVIQSDMIENAKNHLNFPNQMKTLSLVLPRQSEYAPPLSLKIFDSRRFGIYVYAGVHITNILPFLLTPMTSDERTLLLSGIGSESEDNVISNSDSLVLHSKETMNITDTSDIDKNKHRRKYFSLFGCIASLCWRNKSKMKKIKTSTSIATYDILPQEEDSDVSDYDWWTKFYFSLYIDDENLGASGKIPEIKIYESELESQPEFEGFTDMLTSFKMYKGKKTGDEDLDDQNITAIFKGSIKIYPWPSDDNQQYVTNSGCPLIEGYFKNFPENSAMRYTLRVYCIRGIGLRPKDLNGKSDPYLRLILTKNIISDRENVIMRQVNPVFGRSFEFKATFPRDHSLTIQVWDYDMSSSDDLIGETKIDLEKRYYSKYRPHCGLQETYEESGYCEWRAPNKPSVILDDLCKKWNIDKPQYEENSVKVGCKEFSSSYFTVSADPKFEKEVLALSALRRWNEIPLVGFPLVPEHVETRSLYDPDKPGIEQGKLQLWIDILPVTDLPAPKIVNITPRKAIDYELRVIIWNVQEVLLGEDDFFTGEKKSDIYVKGWVTDSNKSQYTDVHYRSLTGEGNFNWRFVFPFKYLPAENKQVVLRKEGKFSLEETEFKIPCLLTLQVWDNDAFSADDFIGTLSLELARFHRGAKVVTKCNLSILDKGIKTINLFKVRRTKGWWPFRCIDPITKKDMLAGKVEAELELLTMEQALAEPAGLGRHEPQALAPPNRPDTSFSWFRNPLMALKFAFCKVYKWKLIKGLLIFLLLIFGALGFYAFPGYSVKKLLGV